MAINYDPNNYYVKIEFEPKWAFIGSIRGFVENFIFNSIKNQELGKSVALTVSELLENAVKYSATEKISMDIQFDLLPEIDETSVVIRVMNFANAEQATILRKIYDKINLDSPKEAYLKRMQEILNSETANPTSQLGLCRIRHECHASLDLNIAENNLITFTAKIVAKNK